jgi:DNA polymerase I-like protein with 3'-5' exonuclease and polymerase domains
MISTGVRHLVDKQYTEICLDELDREDILKMVSENDVIALDTETTGLRADDKIVGICITAFEDYGWYIPTMVWDGKELQLHVENDDFCRNELLPVLLEKKLIFHNAPFDVGMFYYDYKIDISKSVYADTQLMNHTLNEEGPHSMDACVKRYHDHLLLEGETSIQKLKSTLEDSIKRNGGSATKKSYTIYTADMEILADYGAADAWLTLRLFYYLDSLLHKEGRDKFFYNDEVMPLCQEFTCEMKMYGVPIDVAYYENLREELKAKIKQLDEEVMADLEDDTADIVAETLAKEFSESKKGKFAKAALELTGIPVPVNKKGAATLAKPALAALKKAYPSSTVVKWLHDEAELPNDLKVKIRRKLWQDKNPDTHPFNIGSNMQLGKFLFETKGIEAKSSWLTPTGAYKVDAKILKTIRDNHEGFEWIDKFILKKKEEKILSTYVEGILSRQVNGTIYPSFLQHGTTSGRYSCADPNFQNLPANDTRVKEGIVAPPGYKILNADFCLHPKTELLTERGWVPVLEVTETDRVWQVNKDTLLGSWVTPSRLVKRYYEGDMYSFKELVVTENHTMLWDTGEGRKVALSQEPIYDSYYMITGTHNQPVPLTRDGDQFTPIRPEDVSVEHFSGEVGCVTVPEGFITVRSDGQTFVTGNCALEPRCFSFVTADPGLLSIWTEGLDMYSKIAIDVLKVPNVSADPSADNYLKKVDKSARDAVKIFVLSVPYGGTAPTFAAKTGRPVEEHQQEIQAYLKAYPGLKSYMRDREDDARLRGQVETGFGRIRHLPQAKEWYEEFGDSLKTKWTMHAAFYPDQEEAQRLLGYRKHYWRERRQLESLEPEKMTPENEERLSELVDLIRDIEIELREGGGDMGGKMYSKYINLLNNAKNSKIQMIAAHVANASAIKFSRLLKEHNIDGWPCMQVHDEITSIIREDQVELASKLLEEAMSDNWVTRLINVPIFGEPLIADKLSEAKD